MARDHRKLKVFELADGLVVEVYRATRSMAVEERYGLQSQIRRAAVSTVTNIVEGCARRTQRDYEHFIVMSLGSASEVRYLFDLAGRLGVVEAAAASELESRYDQLVRGLNSLLHPR